MNLLWITGVNNFFFLFYRLLPRDADAQNFIGRAQLMDFLCWLDYINCLAKECCVPEIIKQLAENIRIDLFELSIEPIVTVLDINVAGFMLVLMAKIIKQIDSKKICDGKWFLFKFSIQTYSN